MIRKTISCLAALGATVAGFAVLGTPLTAVAGAPASVAREGAATISVASGTSTTAFNLTLPSGASCSGSGGSGYRWETFIAASTIDVSQLAISSGSFSTAETVSPFTGTAVTGYTNQLSDTGGNLVSAKFPAGAPVGLISGIPQMNLSSLAGIPAGKYKVGVFCANVNSGGTSGRLDAGHFWETYITITNAGTLAWTQGWAPNAPVLSSLTADAGQLSGSFTYTTPTAVTSPGPSTAITGFTVTATPQGGGSAVTLPVAVSASPVSFTFTGLTNGTTYDLTVHSTNLIGNSPESNTSSSLVAPPAWPAVTGFTATPGVLKVTLAWTAPATGGTPSSYNVAVSTVGGPVAGSPFSVSGAATTYEVTGLTEGTLYTFTVLPLYASPYIGTISSGLVQATPFGNTLITQTITVTRPVGNLVLTQRCDVHGALPTWAASPGFATIAASAAAGYTDATADGEATVPSGNTAGTAPTGDSANFGEYPYPVDANQVPNAVYPTDCGLSLGIAHLVTDDTLGNVAGEYFAVDGQINQVTVVDTRDTDAGWTLSGSVTNFTSGGNSFSGNYLGWLPFVTDDSDASFSGYNQTVAAGSAVLPALSSGLTAPQVLASANANFGLGIATLDARLKLLIPVEANNGLYTATLTFTLA